METINMIFERYPKVKERYEHNDSENIIVQLTNVEAVFYQLVLFLENPKIYHMSLNTLQDYLRDNDLLFALQIIVQHYQKETDLVINVEQSIYQESLMTEQLAGQSKFAEMVESEIPGVKLKASMINVYWKRGKRIPNADLIISGTPYWKESTIKKFIELEKEQSKRK